MRQLRIGLAQLNVCVGDVEGNARRVLDEIERARALGVDLVAFPELCLTGYPPEDLLFRSAFIEANLRALDRVARAADGPHRRGRLRRSAGRHHERRRRLPRRGRGGRLPQAVPAELRCLRREPVLPGGGGDPGLRAGRGRPGSRGEHLRGHLVPHRADDRADARRGGGGGLDQLVALSRRQGAVPREDAGHPGGGSRRVPRVREPRRRPGRAGVRRPVHGVRPGRRPARPRAGVRGGSGDRRSRPRRGVPREASRLAAAQGEAGGGRSRSARAPGAPAGAARVPTCRRGPPRSSTGTRRCTGRS